MYKIVVILALLLASCQADCDNGRLDAAEGAEQCLSLADTLGIRNIRPKHKKFALKCCHLLTSGGGASDNIAHSCALRLVAWKE